MTQLKRSNGQSAIASAAYRAGQKLYSEYYGESSDYSHKGGVICSEILLPENAPAEYADRQTLWNAVEAVEKNKKAQLAYSFDIALQNEFSMEENVELARQFLLDEFVSRGMIVDFAVHEPDTEDGGIKNPHFHVLCPIRPLNEDGSWGQKQRRVYRLDENGNRVKDKKGKDLFDAVPTTDWGTPETLEHWREAWANCCNQKFAEKEQNVSIDHRSYERQGVEMLSQVHEGPSVRQMEAEGIRTHKGDLNRWIRATNAVLRSLRNSIRELLSWIKELGEVWEELQSYRVLSSLLESYYQEEQLRCDKYSASWTVKHMAETRIIVNQAKEWLKSRKLVSIDDLEDRLTVMQQRVEENRTKLSPLQKRLQKLESLIENAEIYEAYTPVHDESKRLEKGWKRKKEKYDQQHEGDLIRWNAASRYLHANLQSMKNIPVAEWKKEYRQLKSEADQLNATLTTDKEEVNELKKIRKMIEAGYYRPEARKAYAAKEYEGRQHSGTDTENFDMQLHSQLSQKEKTKKKYKDEPSL